VTATVSGTAARMAEDRLGQAERLVQAEVRRGAFPGAALAAGRGAQMAMMKGIGNAEWGRYEVDAERTIYDIASLTKVVGTTTAVMLLVEDGRMALDAPVGRYLPAFSGGNKDRVTVRHLLAHTSGLPAGAPAPGTPAQALAAQIRTPSRPPRGRGWSTRTWGWWCSGPPPSEPPASRWRPCWSAASGSRCRCAPPGSTPAARRATAARPRGSVTTARPVRGVVHDPTARRLGGVAGNAGLFSTAADLARFAAMMASGGELEGTRILREETIRTFTARQPRAGNRALGWETPPATGGSAGAQLSRRAFGHTGFTGTSMWIDPERGTWTVLLANRTFDPQAPNRIQALRRAVNDRVAEAAELADVAALAE
jgi:serine-type D-Ala-D-Ala carboxypeptidase